MEDTIHFVNNESLEEIIEQLIDEYGDAIKRLIYTYIKDWSITEDVTQEVFITCYNKYHLFRGESNIKTWVYQIAVNKAKDTLRLRSYRQFNIVERLRDNLHNGEPSIEDQVIEEDEKLDFSNKVLSLPVKYREAIILFYYEDLTIREINELTGINQQTIKSRLRRGKSLLRKEIEGK
ncbi:sigma-70 family RNA polymerase sigma factor [Alkalihalobacillus sp. AL-G]|uniref:sigma-70 family RNA polymerase sigma factor n=1 Tax=Alkalihalobacillus sp. AL-G TaxID=2926399 RepID=UPI00272A68BD|nr:sigma-70 family RNA polymerase sigma factor [Alkalihalobacillus sp. AL-G]WLD94654.1 sigma-70 family RNA polymerase sigma factor [Alkalihalobacillus sp. AL-G]